jgi:hypothetical protein
VVTINRVILRPDYSTDDLEVRAATLCEKGREEIARDVPWSGKTRRVEAA